MKRAMGLLLAAMVAPASGQELGQIDTTASIVALERAWVESESRNDNRALDQIFDNSLVYVEYGKLMTKAEYLSRVRAAGPHLPQQIVLEVMNVRVIDSTAIVVGTYREKQGQNEKTTVKKWRFIDTWTFKNGTWKLVSAAAAPITAARN